MGDKKRNKIGHSSRSSSIQRIKTNADQRCLIITISENLAFQFLLISDGLKTIRKKDTKKSRKKREIYKKKKRRKKEIKRNENRQKKIRKKRKETKEKKKRKKRQKKKKTKEKRQ